MSKCYRNCIKQQNLLFHPSYCTTACSQPLASHKFCIQTVPFCTVSFQLRHRRRLAASFPTTSHLILCLSNDPFPVNSAFRVSLGYSIEWQFFKISSTFYPTQFRALLSLYNTQKQTNAHILFTPLY